ncbi:MAG: SusC/RagA family TonB-linked outer membrane protein [Bacteroidales bacterium]|jgi:TonB-linked SusC/RagA family outer membrane protein|nr:SusC/RagA family TonB-linked outer membrane protein [Bacteroidales bacterium]
MKIRRINQYVSLLTLSMTLLILLFPAGAAAQKKTKAVPEFWMTGTVVSPNGKFVGNAQITADEGAIVVFSDENGRFKVKCRQGSSLLVEAKGFEPLIYHIEREENELTFTLTNALLYAGTLDAVDLPMGIKEKQRYLTGAVSGVSGDELLHTPETLLSNMIQGHIMGFQVQMSVNGLGNNTGSMFIRGHHRNTDNGIITIVDGVERDINKLLLDEVASVQVLKDATSKILYGGRAANGVVLVTTKHGKIHTRRISASAEMGAGLPVAYPTYLNSYDYARLYNEARQNDGLPPMYNTADLEGYRNSTGPNDLRYPDVDYIDYFLSKTIGYRKAALEFSGGNENMQYAFVAGYTGNTGLQKVGEAPVRDGYNFRANLDMKITDHFKAFVGMAGIFDVTKRPSLDHAGTFTRIRDTRPNEFPLIIDPAYIAVDSLGYPALGASYAHTSNLYGDLVYGGRYRQNVANGELNVGLNMDLSQIVEGLSLGAQLSFDNFFTGTESLATSVATYAQRWYYNPVSHQDTVVFQPLKKTVKTDQNTLSDSWNLRTNAYLFRMDFDRNFNGIHKLSTNLFYYYMMKEATGESTNLQTTNTALRANYSFRNKYVVEMDLALMGSSKFHGSNRHFMSYAGGAGWILTEEDFLKGNGLADYLKVKASGGLLGYDTQTPWNLHYTRWSDNGNYQLRPNVNILRVDLTNWGNPDLEWEKSLEFNAGVEGLLFNRSLWVEANYFREKRFDLITLVTSQHSSIYGDVYAPENFGEVHNQGIEFEVKYMNKTGDFHYSAGINGIYSKNKLISYNEVEYPEENRRHTGKSSDAMFGYVSKGLFGRDVALQGAPHQTFGDYTVGDIAYEDLHKDEVIDENDQTELGNNFPRVHLGLTVDLFYKGFSFNMLGVSQLGVNKWLSNTYYWNFGERKWSNQALNRYHPDNNPEGTYPRLTTTQGDNNFVNSTFWLANTSFFRVKNAEVGYTFGYNKPLSTSVKTVKVFARGTNFLTISKMKELDPEVPDAGVNNYPLFSTFSVGINVVF